MKNPPILTLASTALLLVLGWAGIRSVQAVQDKPTAAESPAKEGSSSEPPAKPAPAEATPEEVEKANALLVEARSRLEERQSLQADLFQQINAGQRKLTAEGTYLSGSPYPKLKLEYRIRIGTMQGTLLEVCDGQILHTAKTMGKVGAKDPTQEFSRRDVQRILAARDNSLNLSVAGQGAEMGVGGLPAMLASIDRCMVGQRITEEEFDGQVCRVFHGVWDKEILKRYDDGLKENKARLVPFFPDGVQVFLTADTLVPVKFVYLKNDLDESGKIVGAHTLMSLELRNLKLDQPLPANTFEYVLPAKREEIDVTNEFLNLIKNADKAFHSQPAPAAK